jgi:hypothetical protein
MAAHHAHGRRRELIDDQIAQAEAELLEAQLDLYNGRRDFWSLVVVADAFRDFEVHVENLEGWLDGSRRRLRERLVEALGHDDGETVEAAVFDDDVYGSWKDELKELKIDEAARRARSIAKLLERARAALPEVTAALRKPRTRAARGVR